MDRATSRSGRPLRRRHDGVDADCAGAAEPSRGGNRSAAGHRYRQTMAAVSWLVARTCRPVLYRDHLDQYVTWMRDERGFTPATVEQWSRTTKRFLLWCAGAGRQLGNLTAGDIGNYVATQGTGRWARVSTANVISALRAFLRYAAQEGWCSNRLGKSISRPRLYQQEVFAIRPGFVPPSSRCWPTSTRTSHGISAIAPSSCCSPSMACGAVKLRISRFCDLLRGFRTAANSGDAPALSRRTIRFATARLILSECLGCLEVENGGALSRSAADRDRDAACVPGSDR